MQHLDDYQRYGRQMVLDGFGLPGQVKLLDAAVVVVGAGGLGCPALQYLAASGIGRLGIIDHDHVELSNLQRQVLHNEGTIGMYKAESAAKAIKQINSRLKIDAMTTAIDTHNAMALLSPYDIILDCTDNAPTRYLLSDTAVRLAKPLVSAAAQKFEGQLCTYNLGPNGPCYRCVFPKPPAPETIGTCAETGILGAVTGIMGNLQALEAVKILTGLREEGPPSMLIFSALGMPPFRSVKLRSRNPACAACGTGGTSTEETDYVQFCGGPTPDWERRGLAVGDFRTSVKEFNAVLSSGRPTHILDVRPATEYGICRLSSSQNVPLRTLVANPRDYIPPDPSVETYVICRLGNDSQIAADALRSVAPNGVGGLIKDVVGGLKAWSGDVDPSFPIY